MRNPVGRGAFAGPSMQKSRRMTWCLIALSLIVASCWGSNRPNLMTNQRSTTLGDGSSASCSTPVIHLERTKRGLYENRGPDLTFIPHNGNTLGNFTGSSNHSGPWGFLQNIPLLFYGPGHVRSQGSVQLDREVTLAERTYQRCRTNVADSPTPNCKRKGNYGSAARRRRDTSAPRALRGVGRCGVERL